MHRMHAPCTESDIGTNSNVICLFAIDIHDSTCRDNSRTKTDITLLIHNILRYTCRHFYRWKG